MRFIKNKTQKPFGVQLDISINLVTLETITRACEPPGTERMASAWIKENCTQLKLGVAAINGVRDSVLFVLGSDGSVHRNIELQVMLPYPIGKNNTKTVEIKRTGDSVFMYFEDIPIMGFPFCYLLTSLLGEPLIDYRNMRKNLLGVESEVEVAVTSTDGLQNLVILSTVADRWFKCENTAVKILSSLILSNNDFPLRLGVRNED